MFWPNCRAIFRMIFEQVECTIDNAFNLRDLVLQELFKINVACFIKECTDTYIYILRQIECHHIFSKLILIIQKIFLLSSKILPPYFCKKESQTL